MSDTLVLNADGLPVSVMPLSTVPWEEAIRYMVLDKADVLLFHENWVVHSATWETQVPSVIMLREYMKTKSAVRFIVYPVKDYQYIGRHEKIMYQVEIVIVV